MLEFFNVEAQKIAVQTAAAATAATTPADAERKFNRGSSYPGGGVSGDRDGRTCEYRRASSAG